MARRSALILVGAGLFLLCAVSPAAALRPGTWTRITGTDQSNTNEVSLARTPDGVLHVAWTRPNPLHSASEQDLLERSISSGGAVRPTKVIASGWSLFENPALVATGGTKLNSLAILVAATRSTKPSETISNLAYFHNNGSGTWSLDPNDVTKTGAPSDMAAAVDSHAEIDEAWGSSSCLCVHLGTDSSTPNHDFQSGLGDFGYEPGMALDPASKRLAVAWYSNGSGHHGVYAAFVDQLTGARIGSPIQMPGTSNLTDGPFSGHTPIAALAGGGLYVAYEGGYPAHTKLLLWRVGAGHSIELAHSSSGVRSVGLASTPAGRLWVFWATSSSSGHPVIHARRSSASATSWGSPVTIKPPKGATTSWNLVGDGQNGPLDLVGSFTIGLASKQASWYTQVLPGLTLQASTHRLKAGTAHAQKVTFTVLDAGTPVKGADVHVGKVSGTTNKSGKVTLALGPFQHKTHLHARASANGYAGASLTLKVS